MRKILFILGAVLVTVGLASPAWATPKPPKPPKVWICHAVNGQGENKNGYNLIEVDASAVDGEGRNDHTHHEGDIIPAPEGGCPVEEEPPGSTTTTTEAPPEETTTTTTAPPVEQPIDPPVTSRPPLGEPPIQTGPATPIIDKSVDLCGTPYEQPDSCPVETLDTAIDEAAVLDAQEVALPESLPRTGSQTSNLITAAGLLFLFGALFLSLQGALKRREALARLSR